MPRPCLTGSGRLPRLPGYFFFGLTVSMTVVLGRRRASETGMYCPFLASRPIWVCFLLAMLHLLLRGRDHRVRHMSDIVALRHARDRMDCSPWHNLDMKGGFTHIGDALA